MLMGNMSTIKHKSVLSPALSNLQADLRNKLIQTYLETKRRIAQEKYESAGLSAGKFCEVILRILQNEVTGQFIPFGQPIPNMATECHKLVTSPKASAVESVRTIIPRALMFLYTLRNKRGIGHVGGDVDANRIDCVAIERTADWIICELIRIYHGLSLEEAQDLIDGISYKSIPDVWEVGGKKRVLKQGLQAKQKTLLLLYSEINSAVLTEDLFDWVEYHRIDSFKQKILRPLHKDKLIEFDKKNDVIYLSPIGIQYVEEDILKSI